MSFWLLAMIATLTALIFVCVLRAPRSPGRLSLILCVGGGFWWTACALFRHASFDFETMRLTSELSWVGIMGTPLFWSLCFVTYARGEDREKPWQVWGVLAIVAFFTIAALTTEWHHGIYAGVVDASRARFLRGPLYALAMIVGYGAMIAAALYGISRLPATRGIHRFQLLALLAGAAVPLAANMAYNYGGFRLFNDDPTPFVFTAAGVAILAAQAFGHLFVLPPIGRDAIFTILPDPVMVFDDNGHILELNPAASALPGIPAEPIGARLTDPPELAELVNNGFFMEGERRELAIAANGRTFEVSYHQPRRWGHAGSRVFLMRDITLRKDDQQQLNALSASLREQLEDNLALQRQLKDEASRDHLTGLFNRRHAYRTLPALVDARRKAGSSALVILDIDHFKAVNDRFGHDAGDAVIKALGAILKSDPRVGEHAFRWGGEEFLAFLPDADREEALARCAIWRAMFAAIDVAPATGLSPTFSAGICLIGGQTLDDAVKAADTALYEAKRSGRNRAVVHEDAALRISA